MSPAQLRDVDDGLTKSVGLLPDLDPIGAHWASLWLTMRASTPGEEPIDMQDLALVVEDEAEFHRALPLMQGMDRVLFDWQRKRKEEERKRAETKAKRAKRHRR